MDALDGNAVGKCGDEDDRYVAYRAQPSSSLDPVVRSIEIDVHQNNIGLMARCF